MVTVVLLPGRGSTLTQAPMCGPVSWFKLGPAWLLWTCLESWTLGYLYLCMSLPSLLGAVALCSLSISEASALSLGVMLALLSLAVPCHCWKKTCKAERCLALNGVTVETRSALWAQCWHTAIAKKKKKKQNKGKTNKQENQLASLINILILNFSLWNRCFLAFYVLIPISMQKGTCALLFAVWRENKNWNSVLLAINNEDLNTKAEISLASPLNFIERCTAAGDRTQKPGSKMPFHQHWQPKAEQKEGGNENTREIAGRFIWGWL